MTRKTEKAVAKTGSKPKAKPKRFPLPKRFNVALSEKAYTNLRELNARWLLGNNYLLVVLLENLEEITDSEALERVFSEFLSEYGAPSSTGMGKKS